MNASNYTGGFSFYAMRGGAAVVHSVDSSARAIDITRSNVELNVPDDPRHQAFAEDAFRFLDTMPGRDDAEGYDLIVLDPPAFTKSSDTVKEGYKGYLTTNAEALSILEKGGVMFTCSCSRFMTIPLFLKMAEEAAAIAKVNVKLLEIKTQAPDHAALMGLDDALYLKTLVLMRV